MEKEIVNIENSDEDRGKVSQMQATWLSLYNRWKPWREAAILIFEFVIGNQLSDAVRKKLAKENRPALVFNLMLPLLVYIAGTLASNKTKLKAVPKRAGDSATTELHNVLVSDFWMENCNGYEEMAKASIDAVICGLGWINNRWDASIDPEGMGITEADDPFTLMFDADAPANKPDSWRYYTKSGYYSAEEIISIYGKYLDDDTKKLIRERASTLEVNYKSFGQPQGWLKRAYSSGLEWLGLKDRSDEGVYKNEFIDAASGMYRVIEWHDKRTGQKNLFYDPMSRKTIDITDTPKVDETGAAIEGTESKFIAEYARWEGC